MNEGKVNPQAIALRKAFEDWYTLNAFDLPANPIGSRECHLQWQAWQAASRASPPAAQGQKPWAWAVLFRGALVNGSDLYGVESAAIAEMERRNKLYGDAELRSILTLFASPAPVPEGWVMVPKIPTLEMQHAYMREIDANRHRMDDHRDSYGWHDANRAGYIAMLSVAPVAPKGET